jgi:hypothetical protein
LAEAIGIEILRALLVSDGRIKSDLRSSPTPSVQTELFQAA